MKLAKEAAKAEVREEKREFAVNVSREVGTPMNGIVGIADLLLDTDLRDEQRIFLELILASAQNLQHILAGLVDSAVRESKLAQLEAVPTDLHRQVRDCVRLVDVVAKEKGLALLCGIDSAVPRVVIADALRIRQVLMNLLFNALHHTDRGDVLVSLRLAAEGEAQAVKARRGALMGPHAEGVMLRFEVRDTGCGIPLPLKRQLDDMFASEGPIQGSEFSALSSVKGMIDLMGGSISMDSDVGRGSKFEFFVCCSLPDEVIQVAELSPHEAPDLQLWASLSHIRTLLVDDEKMNQMITSSTMRHIGVHLDIAETGVEAVGLCERHHYDLILMDCYLPGLDGFDTTRLIRNLENEVGVARGEKRHACIVALTPGVSNHEEERCTAAGMDYFIPKPIRLRDLQMVVRHRLEMLGSGGLIGRPLTLIHMVAMEDHNRGEEGEDEEGQEEEEEEDAHSVVEREGEEEGATGGLMGMVGMVVGLGGAARANRQVRQNGRGSQDVFMEQGGEEEDEEEGDDDDAGSVVEVHDPHRLSGRKSDIELLLRDIERQKVEEALERGQEEQEEMEAKEELAGMLGRGEGESLTGLSMEQIWARVHGQKEGLWAADSPDTGSGRYRGDSGRSEEEGERERERAQGSHRTSASPEMGKSRSAKGNTGPSLHVEYGGAEGGALGVERSSNGRNDEEGREEDEEDQDTMTEELLSARPTEQSRGFEFRLRSLGSGRGNTLWEEQAAGGRSLSAGTGGGGGGGSSQLPGTIQHLQQSLAFGIEHEGEEEEDDEEDDSEDEHVHHHGNGDEEAEDDDEEGEDEDDDDSDDEPPTLDRTFTVKASGDRIRTLLRSKTSGRAGMVAKVEQEEAPPLFRSKTAGVSLAKKQGLGLGLGDEPGEAELKGGGGSGSGAAVMETLDIEKFGLQLGGRNFDFSGWGKHVGHLGSPDASTKGNDRLVLGSPPKSSYSNPLQQAREEMNRFEHSEEESESESESESEEEGERLGENGGELDMEREIMLARLAAKEEMNREEVSGEDGGGKGYGFQWQGERGVEEERTRRGEANAPPFGRGNAIAGSNVRNGERGIYRGK